jgi:hypothetical protein
MAIFLALITGLVVWVVLWGTSLMKSFDAFLIAMLFPLLAATTVLALAYLPRGND